MPILDQPTPEAENMSAVDTPPVMPAAPPEEHAGVLETLDAAERQANIVGSLYDRWTNPKPDVAPVPRFDPLEHTPNGYDPMMFLEARSPEEIQWIRRQVDQENAEKRTLDRAGGWGIASAIVSGITDPITIASMALPFAGETRLAQGLKLAAGTAATGVVQEGAMHEFQRTRGWNDSLLNIGASTLVSGVLGAVIKPKIPQGVADDLTTLAAAELHGLTQAQATLGPIDGVRSVAELPAPEQKALEQIRKVPPAEPPTLGPIEQQVLKNVSLPTKEAIVSAQQRLGVQDTAQAVSQEVVEAEQEIENTWQEAHEQWGTAALTQGGAAALVPQSDEAKQASKLLEAAEPIKPAAGNSVVSTAAGRQVEVRPRLAELGELVTSDQAEYPQELQPRQRDRAALQEQVQNIADHLTPERLGPSPEADRGSPIVGRDNIVESGNGRMMALRKVYESDPVRAEAYKEYLASLGHDVSQFQQPVLVRERVTPMTPGERRAFTVEANQSSIAALSPVERAQADSLHLNNAILQKLADSDLSSARNAGFVRDFIGHIPQAERNELLNPDGTISQAGVRRLLAAILAHAYGGNDASNVVLGRLLESTDSDMRSTAGALVDAAPKFARLKEAIKDGKVPKTYDISQQLTQAVEEVGKLRASGQDVNEYLKQADMLSSRPPLVDALMRAMYRGNRLAGREAVTDRLNRYADQAMKQRLDQADLVGGPLQTPQALLQPEAAAPEMRPPTDMFGLRTAQGKLPDPPLSLDQPEASFTMHVNPNEESTAGAMAANGPTLRGNAIAKGAVGYDRATGFVSPASKVLRSPSIHARQLLQEMVNLPMNLEKNYGGGLTAANRTAQPIERELWTQVEGAHYRGNEARAAQFGQYLKRMQAAGTPALDRATFDEEVAKAMRRGDQSPIPEVAAAAKDSRRIAWQPMFDRAVKAGLLPETAGKPNLFAQSYLMRMFDSQKINGNIPGFLDTLTKAWVARDGMEPVEARDLAYRTFQNIQGSEFGTMDWHATDGLVPKSGRLKARQLTLPDTVLEPWLVSNMNQLEHSYLRSIAPDVLFTERFGSRNLAPQIADIENDYHIAMERNPAQTASLEKQLNRDKTMIAAMRDRLYGVYGQPKDPNSFGVRAGRMLRSDNAFRMLGMAAVSHLPDLANVIMRYGAPNTFASIGKILSSSVARDLTLKTAHRMGAALDMFMNTSASMLGDYVNHSDWVPQQLVNRATRAFTIATGETPLITAIQGLTSTLAQDEILRSAEKVAAGKGLATGVEARLSAQGLDQEMLGRILDQHRQFGAKVNGLNFGMSDKWTDQEARQAFESAVSREAHAVTLRPGVGDTPLFMSKEWGKNIAQFKSFGFAASRSVTAPLLQGLAHGDPRAAQGLLALISMGTLSYIIKQKIAGQPIDDPTKNPAKFTAEVLDKSNLLGWTGEWIFPAATQLGFKTMSRFSDRDPVETLLGPSAGTLADGFSRFLPGRALAPLRNAMGADQDGQQVPGFRRSDIHFMRKLVPAQNSIYLRNGLNHVEDAIGDQFDLPGRSQADLAQEHQHEEGTELR